MAVPVPGSTSGSIVSEYAATNINLNRSVQKVGEFLAGVFSASLSYEKKTYVVDTQGNKVGLVVQQDAPGMMPMNDLNRGSISLDATTFGQYFAKVCVGGEILGEEIAALADQLIREDLIKRGILTV
jgi:hypothetical protein